MALARYGRISLPGTTGVYTQVNADGAPRWGAIGYNIAWDLLIPATQAGSVAIDNTPIAIGDKVIPFGTVLTKVTSGTYAGQYAPYNSLSTLANPTAAPVVGDGGAGALGAGAYTVAYAYRTLSGTTLISPTTAFTLGASKRLSIAAITLPPGVVSVDWYVSKAAGNTDVAFAVNQTSGDAFTINVVGTTPEEPGANTTTAVGLNALGRGTCGIMNVTVKESDQGADLTGLLVGGVSWKERIKAGGAGQPAFVDLEAALPLLEYVKA